MSTLWIVVIIAVVLAMVIGNIMLLKYSAKFKFPANLNKKDNKNTNHYDDEDDW